jgi:hypothetical protein
MTERMLYDRLVTLVLELDPTSFTYTPGQTVHRAREALQIARELRLRGSQLSLLPPAG